MTPARSLPSELTIYTVGELRPQWLAWLADAPAAEATEATEAAFAVAAAAVEEVDAAGVQLLLSLQQSLAVRQQDLLLVSPSRALSTACCALGLAALVGLPEPTGVPA